MNASNVSRKIMQQLKLYMLGATVASAMALPTTALGWDYSQVPLFWDTGVHPNVALMLDDSGSMTALTINESYQRGVLAGTLSSQDWYWCNSSYNYPNKRCVNKDNNAINTFNVRVWTPPTIAATNLSVNSAYASSTTAPANCSSSSNGFARNGTSGTTLNGTICRNNHGLTNGSALKYTTPATAPTMTGFTVGTTYYVINSTQHGFQLSTSLTGGAIVPTISADFGSGSFTFSGFKSGSLPEYINGRTVALCNTSKAPGTVGHYIGVSGSSAWLSSNELPTANTVGVLVSRTTSTSAGTNDSCVRWQMANTQNGTAAPYNRDGSRTEYDVGGYAKHLLNTLTSATPASLNFTNAAQYPVTDADTVNFVAAQDNKVIPNRNRMESAREAGQQIVLDNHHRMQIGLFSFDCSGSCTGERNLSIPDGTDPDQEKKDLISTTESMLDADMPLSAADGAIGVLDAENSTPLGATQTVMNNYFKGASSPIQYRCQKNYTVVMTDGDPTSDTGTLDGGAQTGYDTDCKNSGLDIGGGSYESAEFGGKWEMQNIETFTVGFGLENNLLKRTPLVNKVDVTKSDITANTIKLTSHGLNTGDYVQVVSGAAGGLTNGNFYYAVKVDGDKFKLAASSAAGDTASTTANSKQKAFDCAAGITSACVTVSGGSGTMVMSTGPGKALFAQTPQQLSKALGDIFNKIAALVASASAVSTNSKQLGASTLVYQARFNTEDWSGEVAAYAVDPITGKVNTSAPAAWTTKNTLNDSTDHGTMLTWNKNTGAGATFDTLANIGATNSAALNDDINALNWLRGNNIATPAGFRSHSANGLIGDIINADPVFVGALNFGYGVLPPSASSCTNSGFSSSGSGCTGAETYTGYLSNRKAIATPMLFVGTNGGQMHVLNAGNGTEIMSFLPAGVYTDWEDLNNDGVNNDGTSLKKMYSLTQDTYDHRFFVDGAGGTSDAFVNNAWRAYFVGALGAGGRSVYAIDASDASFSASDIKWEFTDPNLGYTYGKPVIARFSNNEWYAVFPNGTDSNGDKASVFVVNIDDVTDFHELTVSNGDSPASPNGMMTLAVAQDNTRTAQYIYAGDMKGNIWKFNVGGGSFPAGSKLFTARDPGNMVQSITGGIRVGKHPSGTGNLVYFGTGKYFENADKSYTTTSVPQVDSFYAVYDDGTLSLTRAQLQQQTFTTVGGLRTGSNQVVTFATEKGWYIDLTENGTKKGERVVSTPVLSGSRIIFVSIVPSGGDKCISNGTSWLNELNALDGNQLDDKVLDTNGDGKIDNLDTKVSSVQLDGMASEPSILQSGDGKSEKKIMGSTSATSSILTVTEKPSESPAVGGTGRMSWEQVQ